MPDLQTASELVFWGVWKPRQVTLVNDLRGCFDFYGAPEMSLLSLLSSARQAMALALAGLPLGLVRPICARWISSAQREAINYRTSKIDQHYSVQHGSRAHLWKLIRVSERASLTSWSCASTTIHEEAYLHWAPSTIIAFNPPCAAGRPFSSPARLAS